MTLRKALLTIAAVLAALGASALYSADPELYAEVRATICDTPPAAIEYAP
jgi:hypothetical protein